MTKRRVNGETLHPGTSRVFSACARPAQQIGARNPAYTVGQVARACGVAAGTVRQWIRTKALEAHALPGSGVQRVYQADLVRFARANRLTLAGGAVARVLVMGLPTALRDEVEARLPLGWALESARSLFTAGAIYWRERPAAVILGTGLPRADCLDVAQLLARDRPPPLLAVVRPDDQPPGWLGVPGVVELSAAEVTAEAVARLLERGE